MIPVQELQEKMSDRKWRLNNLYHIKNKKGDKILFKMKDIQEELHDNLWFFNIIPKARQLGITTFFCILYFDQILFSDNKTAVIIAHRQEDMKKIFKNNIKFAWDNLHPWLKAKIGEPDSNSANELTFPNGSSISVALSTRSGTVQYLHVSEFGKICARMPDKAEEIVTGAINSVEAGQMVSIESTTEGREGYFYEFCDQAEKMRLENRELTPLDFKIFFFPWWRDPSYTMDADFAITDEYKEYFRLLEQKYHIALTSSQQRWYIKKKDLNKENMFREYPSTLEEAFSASVEGAYYSKEMARVYLDRRITSVPVDEYIPVDTYWDLGMNDLFVIIFVQSKGPQIRIIDCYFNHGESLAHYAKILETKGYRYGKHVVPHDIAVKEQIAGISRKQALYDLGLRNIIVAPKLGIQDGIQRVRAIFSKMYFDEEKTRPVYEALQSYRREWDAKMGTWKDNPRHDDNSHFADPIRSLAAVWREDLPLGEDGKEGEYPEESFFG